MPVESPWTRCLSPEHLSLMLHREQPWLLTCTDGHYRIIQECRCRTRCQELTKRRYFIGICQHMTKRDFCVSTEDLGKKNKSCGRSEHGCGDCLFHSSSTEGGARWCKVTEDRSGVQVASSCHLYSVVLYSFQIFFVSKWSCLQPSHWMVEFIIKTLFSVLLRNQVLNCKWLILISMQRCITSTSVWKGNENMSWLEGKCILTCENEWWAFRQRNCFIQVKLEKRKCTKTANAGTLCRTHKRRQG